MKELINSLIHEFMDKDYAHAYMDSHQSTRIATQIKVLREQRELTQKQLAELCKMKQERISALEDVHYDAWTISTLRKLAYAFDTTLQISFIPFSQGIQDIADFGREYLQVESRETDLMHVPQVIKETGKKSIFKWTDHTGSSASQKITRKPKEGDIQAKPVTYQNNPELAVNDDNYQDCHAA